MITLYTTIERAHALKKKREELGLTLHDAARALGVSVAMVCDLESGKLYSHDWDKIHVKLAEYASFKRSGR